MRTYTPGLVERLVRNYPAVRSTLCGGAPPSQEATYTKPIHRRNATHELPFGMSPNDPRGWPFREPRHAKAPRDGKAKARSIQDLHCMCLDFERATFAMSEDDLMLIYRYFLIGETLEEVCAHFGVASRGSMQRRAQRAIARLAVEMESPSA